MLPPAMPGPMDEHDPQHPSPPRDRPPGAQGGRLVDVQVPELLWQLHEARRTGCLTVQHGVVRKQLWWKAGQPVFARSNQSADRLTDRLLARGLLTRAQYDATQTMVAGKTGKRIGELMLDAGLIGARELQEALCEHLLRMLDSMFLWEDGRWWFEADVTCAEPIILNVPTAAIIMGGARHRIPLRRLWESVGPRDQRPLLHGERRPERDTALAAELALEPSEASWLPQLDASRDLAAMLDDFDTDEHELLSLIYTLKMIRRLDLIAPEPRPFSAQR